MPHMKLAKITSEFLDFVRKLKHFPVFLSPGSKKYITVKRIGNSQPDPSDYYYVERAGVDSVAFLLLDRLHFLPDQKTSYPTMVYQVLTQWHGPTNKFRTGAFTGSLDKDKPLNEIVADEVNEEAGFFLNGQHDRIIFMRSCILCGNSNETVHLFLVDITGLSQQPRPAENIFEANTQRTWMTQQQIFSETEDWKAHMIVHAHRYQLMSGTSPKYANFPEPDPLNFSF